MEISFAGDFFEHIEGRLSGVLYTESTNGVLSEIFGGLSAAGYLHPNNNSIDPHLGLGFFIGDTFNCSNAEEQLGTCEEETVAAIYPEIGIAFNLSPLRIYPFARRYFDTNDHTGHTNAYGIHLGLKF